MKKLNKNRPLTTNEMERARALHERASIIDALTYIPIVSDPAHFSRMISAGISGVHVSIPDSYDTHRECMRKIAGWYAAFDSIDNILMVKSADDISRAKQEKKVAIIMGSQTAEILDGDLGMLSIYDKLGLKILQIAHYKQNLLGAGCFESKDHGLTDFGVKVVEEMNRLRMLIDISHCGEQTSSEVIEVSKYPVAATHANPRKIANHFRNKSDDQIKALAEKRGVIGMNAWSRVAAEGNEQPSLDRFMEILEYTINLVGSDHVALGLDFTPMWTESEYAVFRSKFPALCDPFTFETRYVKGLSDHTGIFEVTKGLVALGYSDQEILKILGGNWLTLFRNVW